jgi:hypothetical protein
MRGYETPGVALTARIPVHWLMLHVRQSEQDNHAQVKESPGRDEALQKDWHRQNQARPDQNASYPYVEGDEHEAEAGKDRLRIRC